MLDPNLQRFDSRDTGARLQICGYVRLLFLVCVCLLLHIEAVAADRRPDPSFVNRLQREKKQPDSTNAILRRLPIRSYLEMRNLHDPNNPQEFGPFMASEVKADYDYYVQADNYSYNKIDVTFVFFSNPGRVYFSRSSACGTIAPADALADYIDGYYVVSTSYIPCEDECSVVTITANPTSGLNQEKTIHLDDRQHIWCDADSWERELCVTTHDPETGECDPAFVTVTVIPPGAGTVSPTSGNSHWDSDINCYVFCSTYSPSCTYSGRVRVKFHTSGNDVIFSFELNTSLSLTDSWQTVSDSFCSEGEAWMNFYQVYRMYLEGSKHCNFSLCGNDGVGASCSENGDLKMFDSSGTSLWYINGNSSCGYDASTIGTAREDWSPPSSGYYYLKVYDYSLYPMNYTLAYQAYDDIINHCPQLSVGYVTPSAGYPKTTFYWYVHYFDEDHDPPTISKVYIDGVGHTMTFVPNSGTSWNGTYGYGQSNLGIGSHNYYFSFSDGLCGVRLPQAGTDPGPSVADPNMTISIVFTEDANWMYQNLPGADSSRLTACATIVDDPLNNGSYTYRWEIIHPNDVSLFPVRVGPNDANCYTFAARGCDEPNGVSDLGQTFRLRVTVTGDDYSDSGTADARFGICLLGDINNDCLVDLADRSIINAFWKGIIPGNCALRDCDVNCDGTVDLADRSIVNAIWKGTLCQNEIGFPCPWRTPCP